jgi:arylsulfatase A-like enzyme
MIVRYPGHVPAGVVSNALQSQIDFVPTFLDAAGIKAPGTMQGSSRMVDWGSGGGGTAGGGRDWALVENRHNPTSVHLRTLVTDRYKITVYRDHDYGELFDLEGDPGELHNLWSDPNSAILKQDLLLRFVQAEIQREPTRMSRITHA